MATTRLVSSGEEREGGWASILPSGALGDSTRGWGPAGGEEGRTLPRLWPVELALPKAGPTWGKNEIDPKVGQDFPDIQATFIQC